MTGRFLVRRGGEAVLVVLGATLLVFLATLALGDPFTGSGERAVPPAIVAANRARFGLDRPLAVQYLTYLGNLARLDLGVDFDQGRPVARLLAETVPNTGRLALVAIALDLLLGLGAGVLAAVRRRSVWDALVTVLSTVGIGVPVVVVGVALVANLAGVGPFPPVPRGFTTVVPWYREVLLPAVTLAAVDAAFIARLMRGSMLDALRADHVRTARAKGLTEATVLRRHVVRTAVLPVLTYAGVALGALCGGAVVTETIFQYDGVGYLLARAVATQNAPVIIAVVLLGVVAYVLVGLLVDGLHAALDPRVRP